jgi:ribosomal-protein-serine acetyltransferase
MARVILEVDASITLKQYVLSDSMPIFKLIDSCRSHLSQYGDNTAKKYPTLKSVQDSIRYPQNKSRLRLGIWEGKTLVGAINLTPNEDSEGNSVAEIGYFIGERFQGNGYVNKALSRLIDYASCDLEIQMLYAKVHKDNQRSMNVLSRAGFQKAGIEKEIQRFYLERD